MAKTLSNMRDAKLKEKSDKFLHNVKSNMVFQSDYSGDFLSFEWIDEMLNASPYIDNIVRRPRVTLISDENVEKIEKTHKVTVESVKHLARHTEFIDEIDQEDDIRLSRILDVRNEETYNIYENRFVYTLINDMMLFVQYREKELEDFETKGEKVLEYASSTKTNNERINIELKVVAVEHGDDEEDKFKEQIEEAKRKIKQIKELINSWYRLDMYKALNRSKIPAIKPPIRKTNLILKNPNFQVATKLWEYIRAFLDEKEEPKDDIDTEGDQVLKSVLNQAFLMDYFVLDSISKGKRDQKNKLGKHAVVLVEQLISQAVELLLNCGIKVTEADIAKMVAEEIKRQQDARKVGQNDVKDQFRTAMEEYLEHAKECL